MLPLIPSTPLLIDRCAPDVGEQITRVLSATAWRSAAPLPPAAVRVRPLHGGITNSLFCASCEGCPPALVRLFGAGTELLIDRAADDATTAALAASGLGVPLLARFGNGRVEGYLAARPLEPAEMGERAPVDLAMRIAREVAALHCLEGMPNCDLRAPLLWPTLTRWLRLARSPEASFGDPAAAAAYATLDLAGLASALEWLQGQLPCPPLQATAGADGALEQARASAAALASSVVFAHNDLLSGNILVSDARSAASEGGCDGPTVAEGRVQLIDYEYSGWNYLGFDIANHFCEHAGFEFDLRRYPSRALQEDWLRAYLSARGLCLPTRALPAGGVGSTAPEEEDEVSRAFMEELCACINRFTPVSDAWWGLWAVLQALHSPLTFDFLPYAQRRLAAFALHMELFWGGAHRAAEAPVEAPGSR